MYCQIIVENLGGMNRETIGDAPIGGPCYETV